MVKNADMWLLAIRSEQRHGNQKAAEALMVPVPSLKRNPFVLRAHVAYVFMVRFRKKNEPGTHLYVL